MRLKILVLLLSSLFLASCGSSKKTVKRPTKKVVINEPAPEKLPSVKQDKHIKKLKKSSPKLNKHTLNYIKKYASLAVREMHEHKIPASITLAQGILESGNGRSLLATKSKNHFGIKCHRGWKGASVEHDDDKEKECFRKYKYVETSYKDHSAFLTKRKRYAFLFKLGRKDYKAWARGLKKAGYATDKKYPKKLINLIKTYKLYEFDNFKKKDFKRGKKKAKKIKETPVVKVEKAKGKHYTVKKGDTLYSIARRLGTTVGKLKEVNGLTNNTISIGQRLKY